MFDVIREEPLLGQRAVFMDSGVFVEALGRLAESFVSPVTRFFLDTPNGFGHSDLSELVSRLRSVRDRLEPGDLRNRFDVLILFVTISLDDQAHRVVFSDYLRY